MSNLYWLVAIESVCMIAMLFLILSELIDIRKSLRALLAKAGAA